MNLHEVLLASRIAGKNNGNGENVDLSDYYTKSQTNSLISEKVAEIVANAPEDFNTLKEISDWIESHEDSAAAMNSAILANTTAITTKVDKVSGKGLSTNDFTDADKTRLDSLENYDDTGIKADVAELVSQTAINKSTIGYQRKNLLPNKSGTTTSSGVTFTVNSDGSVVANGTSTGSANVILNLGLYIESGEFILSGCPKNGGSDKYELEIQTDTVLARDYGDSVVVNLQSEIEYKVKIIIRNGITANNLKFYPMIRPADVTDSTYEPYKPSVEERLMALENAILGGN
ncbi:MAG: hypothetical protein K2I06_14190 [Ruminococcus sp.]|nr:hypothetical protein [Ruminococcus sp.]